MWLVLDMDDGLLRREPTRAAALDWWMKHNGTTRVVRRYSYGSGAYEYVTAVHGDADDTCGGVFIETEAAAARGGWDTMQAALYPLNNQPHVRVDREP